MGLYTDRMELAVLNVSGLQVVSVFGCFYLLGRCWAKGHYMVFLSLFHIILFLCPSVIILCLVMS